MWRKTDKLDGEKGLTWRRGKNAMSPGRLVAAPFPITAGMMTVKGPDTARSVGDALWGNLEMMRGVYANVS